MSGPSQKPEPVFDDAIDAKLRREEQERARREIARQRVRENFPEITKFADEARKHFGDGVEITWAIENGKSVGRVPKDVLEEYCEKHGPVQPLRLRDPGDTVHSGPQQGKRSQAA